MFAFSKKFNTYIIFADIDIGAGAAAAPSPPSPPRALAEMITI